MTNAYAPSILRQTLCRDSESNNKQKANFPVKNLSRIRIRAVSVLLFAIALFAPRIVWGQFEYNGGSTTNYLSTAIYYANAGSTIYVTGDNGNLAYNNERIDLTKSITIKSNVGGTKRTIKRVGNNQWIRVAGTYTLTIEDFVLDGQNYNTSFSMIQGSGGASITMYNCEVKNCYKSGNAQGSSNNGAAINISGASSDLTCVSVIFQNNINTETHTPIGSVVYGGGGVAIGNRASFTLTSCEFYGNEAYEGGGAIYMEQAGTGSIRGCTIGKSGSGNANKAGIVGGGIYGNTYKGYTVTIDGTTSIQYNEVVVMDGNSNDKGYFGQGGGVYFINGRDTGNITIGDAAGSNKVNISNNKARGGAGGVMFWCTATSESVMTIQNFTMENNYGGNTTHNFYDSEFNFGGGGIFVVGSLDVTHSADHIIIKNGTISDCYAVGYGGGLFINNHDCVVRNVTFTNNYTTNDPSSNRSWGGAVMVNGKVSGSDYSYTDYFYNCVFHKNGIKRADKTVMTTDGGALYSHRITNVQMLGCTIGGSMANANKATNNGGGIHMGQNSYLTLDKYGTTSTKVSYNEAGSNGGGIYVADGSQGHTNIGSNSTGYPVEISNNKAEQNGGGIYLDCGGYNDDQFTLCNFKLNENTALHGGGAYLLGEHVSGVNHGAMTISNGEVKDNHATSMGGGIYFDEHDATVTSVDFIHNRTNTGTDTSVPSGIGVGGGVLMAGHSNHTVADHDHDFTNCSFIQNEASVGGAALVMRKTNATFNSCSIGGKTAYKNIASIDGGGVYVEELSKANFINGTMVSYNEAKNGGGVYVAGYEGSGNPNDYMNVVCEASVSAPSSYGAYFGIYTKNGSTYTLVSGSSMTLTGSSSGVIRESNLQKNVNYYVLARPIPNDEYMYSYPIICSMSGIAGTIQIYNSSWSSPTGYSNYVWNKPAWSSLSGLAHGTVTIGSTSYYDIIHFRVVPDEDVDASGYATVNGSTVSNNKASNQGGGIYIEKLGEVLLDGSNALLVQSNTANDKGGGVYKLGTLKVKGNTTVTENTSGTAKAVIRNNVYIPTSSADGQTILITGALTCGSSIGVTKTKTDHTYDDDDNFNQVRTAIAKVEPASPTQTWALDAYHNNVFFDDTDKFGVWSFNYHKTNDANDYSAQNDYFIETWRSYANDTDTDIESSSSGYFTNVKSNKGLAYFAKMVNSGLDYASLQTYLVADIDLAGHYWEPIGFSTGSTCNPVTDYKFSGNFDGQGHLIRNAISILPAKTMGLFGNVDGGSVIHTFNIGADFTGTFDGETHIGGIAGQVTGSSALIDRCEAQGSMQRYGSAASNTGGIAGNVASGEVRNSFAVSSNLSGTTVGGLVGKNAGSVKNAYAVNNTLPGSGTVGALVGNNTGTLSNAYTDASSGNVVGSGPGTNVYSAGATGATTYTPPSAQTSWATCMPTTSWAPHLCLSCSTPMPKP